MALLFIDGFDHYSGNPSAFNKWDIGNNDGAKTDYKRTGNNSLYVSPYYKGDSIQHKKVFQENNIIVVGFALYKHNDHDNRNFLQFLYNSSLQIAIKYGENRTFDVYRDTTLLGSTDTNEQFVNQWNYYEFKIKFHTSEGYVIIRRDEREILSLNNINTDYVGNNLCNAFGFAVTNYTSTDGTYDYYIDDFYIDNADFQGDIKILTLYPDSNGSFNSWIASTGDNYACIDETTINNDTDYIYTSRINDVDLFSISDINANDEDEILGVQVNITARMDDSGFNEIAPVLKPSSTIIAGNNVILDQTYKTYLEMFNTNPDDNNPWKFSDFNQCEFGVKMTGN